MIQALFASGMTLVGLFAIFSRRNLIGWLMGVHLLFQGFALFGVLLAIESGLAIDGQVFGFIVLFLGFIICISVFGIVIRLFYLKKSSNWDEVRGLKN